MVQLRLALSVLALALVSCDELPATDYGRCVPSRVAHVERFGYYWGANDLPDVAGYSNLYWGGPKALTDAAAAGAHAIVDVQGIFKIASGAPPADGVIAANWATLADQLRPNLAALDALYPSDEPYLNGELNGVAPAEVQRRLEAAAQLVRSTAGFEQVRLAAIFSDRCLDIMQAGLAGMPAGYDWVGWDRYGSRIDRADDRMSVFVSFLRPDQRVIAVPDAMLPIQSPDVIALRTRIAFWLAWIESHPQVVAVTPFIYDSSSKWIGARDIPFARARYEQIGSCILEANTAR